MVDIELLLLNCGDIEPLYFILTITIVLLIGALLVKVATITMKLNLAEWLINCFLRMIQHIDTS